MEVKDIYWLAGFIEGEGCFICTGPNRATPVVSVSQVQKWPLIKLQRIYGGNLWLNKEAGHGFPNRKPQWRWTATGILGAGLMMTLYPLLSPGRQEKIKIALKKWRTVPPARKYKLPTHCKYGHAYEGNHRLRFHKNRKNPSRRCLICQHVKEKERWQKILLARNQ